MSQPRVLEVDYYRLVDELKRAADGQCLIQRKDKERWRNYVKQHSVRETALEAFGKVKFASGKPQLAIIANGSDWEGCYAYSVEDECALKYVP